MLIWRYKVLKAKDLTVTDLVWNQPLQAYLPLASLTEWEDSIEISVYMEDATSFIVDKDHNFDVLRQQKENDVVVTQYINSQYNSRNKHRRSHEPI